MKYVKRTVRSQPGLSQEQALLALQSQPEFTPGTRIASIRRKENYWVASILQPKVAAPPPAFADDGESDGPPVDDAPSDEAPDDEAPTDEPDGDEGLDIDGPPSDDEGKPKDKKGEKGDKEGEILSLLHTIIDALGLDAGPEGMGGPDALGPDAGGPAAPPAPHHGPGAGGPPKGPGAGPGRPMKPGEAPPGATPVGAPAFASVADQITAQMRPLVGRSAQITLKAPQSFGVGNAVKVAKTAAEPLGYGIKQAKKTDDGKITIIAYAR